MTEPRKKYQIDADKLRAARKQAALSVEELSEKARRLANLAPEQNGFSVSGILHYEKGGANIDADKLKILASVLGIKPEGIIFFDTPELLSQTPQFRSWYGFVESTHYYKDKFLALALYKDYEDFVFSFCTPYWEALKEQNSTQRGQKKNFRLTHNTIYTYTRKFHLKKRISFSLMRFYVP